ncbi:retrovirus-related pol polyprotein from transposon TNT 1-94 [Tanacetum coccineum]
METAKLLNRISWGVTNTSTIVSRIHPTNSNGLRRLFKLLKVVPKQLQKGIWKLTRLSDDVWKQLDVEAKAVQIILTGIDNDIYSTADACPNACEMRKAIERLKQGESINVQDLETNLYWEFGKFASRDGESLESYYSRQQQAAATRNRGKAMVTSSTLTYDQAPVMVAEDDEMSKEKEIDKLMALISQSFKKIYKPTNNNLRNSSNTSRANQDNTPKIDRGTGYDNQRAVNVVGARANVGTQVVQHSGIQCYNCKEYGHVARECQKPKRAKDAAYHREKMLLYDTDDEQEDQELEAHYMYMAQIREDRQHPEQPKSINDTYSMDMSPNGGEVDHDDDDDLAKERDLLASLIEKLKCEINESKNRNKFLESSNKTLVDKLKSEIEDFKNKNKSLESLNNHFKEANTELAKTNKLMFKDIKKFQDELDRYHDVNYALKVELDCAKSKGELIAYKISSEKSFNE